MPYNLSKHSIYRPKLQSHCNTETNSIFGINYRLFQRNMELNNNRYTCINRSGYFDEIKRVIYCSTLSLYFANVQSAIFTAFLCGSDINFQFISINAALLVYFSSVRIQSTCLNASSVVLKTDSPFR